ncbi:hypothetical protein G7Y79_00074g098850 [Physcia stellaris]|nr:hypothetical protein G7Y79_00074g098850 [Physcia stellaris]
MIHPFVLLQVVYKLLIDSHAHPSPPSTTQAVLYEPTIQTKRNRHLRKMNLPTEPFPEYIDPYTTTPTTLEPRSTNPTPTSKTAHLTFGVEFEFILAIPIATLPPPPPASKPPTPSSLTAFHDSHICARLAHILRRSGLAVNPWEGRVVDYSLWTVDQDASITACAPSGKWRGYHFCGVELKTPVLDFSVAGLGAIAYALEVLGEEYGERAFVNESCGLHVHVGSLGPTSYSSFNGSGNGTGGRGKGESVGFPLNTLKNLATLVTVFNRAFNSLHPSHRVENAHCRSPAANFRALDPWAMAEAINRITSVDALAALMCRDREGEERGMAYNFLNLSRALGQGAGLNTLEFRQHAASLDARKVGVWVTLCCEFVAACGRLSAVGMVSLVVDHLKVGMGEDVYGICELLRDLDLGALARYFEGRGVYRHQKMEWEVRDPRMVGVEMVVRDGRAEAEAEMEARGWPVNSVDTEVDEEMEDDLEEWGMENLGESDVEEDTDVMLDRLDADLRMQQRGVWR